MTGVNDKCTCQNECSGSNSGDCAVKQACLSDYKCAGRCEDKKDITIPCGCGPDGGNLLLTNTDQ